VTSIGGVSVTSFHVRVFAIRRRPGRRAFEVRWRVAGQDRSRSFMTRALAACPRTGTAWTSTGTSFEPRGLKHRPDGTIRIAPSRPSWSACSASTYTRSPPRRTGGCSAAATSATAAGTGPAGTAATAQRRAAARPRHLGVGCQYSVMAIDLRRLEPAELSCCIRARYYRDLGHHRREHSRTIVGP
jgi:hypothetical protein